MGVQEKHEVEGDGEWVVAGISLRSPLRPIKMKTSEKSSDEFDEDGNMDKTPVKEKEARGAKKSVCPPAPKKPKPSLICRLDGIDFFHIPDDLETVFIRREEIAK